MNLSEFTKLINTRYLHQFNTLLMGGFDEPLYLPGQEHNPAVIRFTKDYYRSALHELAHWCVAGKERRKLEDYGYWYVPDGRNQQQQNEFYDCEIKPQAIEWAFSIVCGIKFDVSVDNINKDVSGDQSFRKAVRSQLITCLNDSFPCRANELLHLICEARFGSAKRTHDLLVEVVG